jgi:hypothetical protein
MRYGTKIYFYYLPLGHISFTFKIAHREASTRAVHAITLEQTNAAIASRVVKISVEFTAKEVVTKKLMAAERRAAMELEEKAACNVGYPA